MQDKLDELAEAVDEFLEPIVRSDLLMDEDETPDEPDVRLYNPLDYVIDTWLAYRSHGILPETGALNDQDPMLIHDWRVMNARYNYLAAQLRKDKQDSELPFPSSNNAKDWTDL